MQQQEIKNQHAEKDNSGMAQAAGQGGENAIQIGPFSVKVTASRRHFVMTGLDPSVLILK
jgi:hypothetical protein